VPIDPALGCPSQIERRVGIVRAEDGRHRSRFKKLNWDGSVFYNTPHRDFGREAAIRTAGRGPAALERGTWCKQEA
jgi:hypothetical protein